MESTLEPSHKKDCRWHSDCHKCNCGLFDTLAYVEPGESGEPVTHYLSVEEAICKQVKQAEQSHNFTYNSQEEALLDFMANNWAWFAAKLGD